MLAVPFREAGHVRRDQGLVGKVDIQQGALTKNIFKQAERIFVRAEGLRIDREGVLQAVEQFRCRLNILRRHRRGLDLDKNLPACQVVIDHRLEQLTE